MMKNLHDYARGWLMRFIGRYLAEKPPQADIHRRREALSSANKHLLRDVGLDSPAPEPRND